MASKLPPQKRVTLKKIHPPGALGRTGSAAGQQGAPMSSSSSPAAPDPSLAIRQMQENVQDALNKLSTKLAAVEGGGIGMVPIGSYIWIDISLAGVPTPAANFIQANGQKITDQRSPMVGQSVRDVNVAGNFIRGAATSGVVQAADAVVPAHAHAMAAHVHDLGAHTHGPGSFVVNVKSTPNSTTGSAGSGVNTLGANNNSFPVTGTSAASAGNTLGPNPANTSSDGGSGAETRPKNVSMVCYVRIW